MRQDQAITRRHFVAGSVVLGAARTARAEAALPVVGIDHVNIRVPDVRRTAEFYTKLFGVEVARSPKAAANPGSKPGELWFVRLGQSFLAISPMSPDEKPGIDHFCFAIEGFNGEAMKSKIEGLNRQFSDPPGNNLWAKDPAGHLIQMSAPASSSRVPGAGVGAVLVEAAGGAKREPAFQATRITELTLAAPKLEPSAGYYRKLLGQDADKPQRGRFRVGQSELILGPRARGESFGVGVIGFDPSVTASRLKNLGVAVDARDKTSVSFRDPDGIRAHIGG